MRCLLRSFVSTVGYALCHEAFVLVLASLVGSVLGGCATVVPVYLDTTVDAPVREQLSANPTDSVHVAIGSTVEVDRFSPFGDAYAQSQNGAWGVHIPIRTGVAALVSDYATHRFAHLTAVTRHPPGVPFDSLRGTATRPTGTRLRVWLKDFRIKQHAAREPANPSSRRSAAPPAATASRAPGHVVRGVSLTVRVAVHHRGRRETIVLHQTAEQTFNSVRAAKWKPLVNAVNAKMLDRLDRFVTTCGL